MTLADAIKIVAYREHLSDLDAALWLIGYQLREESLVLAPEAVEIELAEKRQLLERARHRRERRLADQASSQHGRPDSDVSTKSLPNGDLAWSWGRGVERLSTPIGNSTMAADNTTGFICAELPRQAASGPGDLAGPGDSGGDVPIDEVPFAQRRRPIPESPLPPGWNKELMRVPRPARVLDIEKVVARLARLQPIAPLPMRNRIRPARRVDLVVDIGLLVGPLGQDLQAIERHVSEAFSDATVRRIAFSELLSDGCGEGPLWTWGPYRQPRESTATIVVTGSAGDHQAQRAGELEIVLSALARTRGQSAHGIWLGALPEGLAGTGAWTEVA